jgi:hypothetical protein
MPPNQEGHLNPSVQEFSPNECAAGSCGGRRPLRDVAESWPVGSGACNHEPTSAGFFLTAAGSAPNIASAPDPVRTPRPGLPASLLLGTETGGAWAARTRSSEWLGS